MSVSIFNENMTSVEARKTLFVAVENKTKIEMDKIKHDYSEILPKIIDKELQMANNGWNFE